MTEDVPAALDGERVDRVVAMLTGLARAEVSALVTAGAVRLGGRPVTKASQRVAAGDVLEADLPADVADPLLAPEPSVDVPVVYADDHVVVVDKPAGMVVHPGAGHAGGTMVQGLVARYPDIAAVGDPSRPGVVHRLDKGTSGLLGVARTPVSHETLVAALAARSVERRYLALAWGRFEATRGMVDAPVGRGVRDPTKMAVSARGKQARTHYEVQQAFSDPVEVTLVACRLETGRTHQIRVHLAAIGHPVVGDGRYGGARASLPATRPLLHAWRLAFDHPATGEPMTFESPVPADLAAVLAGLA